MNEYIPIHFLFTLSTLVGSLSLAAGHEPVEESSSSEREAEPNIFLEVCAQVVEMQMVQDLKSVSPREDVARHLLFLGRQQRRHPD